MLFNNSESLRLCECHGLDPWIITVAATYRLPAAPTHFRLSRRQLENAASFFVARFQFQRHRKIVS
jgi:hypothetical protein